MGFDDDEGFDPGEHNAPEVVAHLNEADEEEKRRVAAAELAERDKPRVTVMAAAGVDPGTRLDASGRELNAWEVSPPQAESGDEA